MSGRKNIIIGDLTQGDLKGEALADALAREMLQDEKSATYQSQNMKHDTSKKKG